MLQTIKRSLLSPLGRWYRTTRYHLGIAARSRFRDDPSQAGEVSFVRRLLDADFPRVLIDVGANDGYYLSNSYPFVRDGWKSLLVEPHPQVFERLQRLHASQPNAACERVGCGATAGTAELFLPRDRSGICATACTDDNEFIRDAKAGAQCVTIEIHPLSDLLDRHGFPKDIGLLSIDAEGMDYEVLCGLDFNRYRPRLIIVEEYDLNKPQFEARNQLFASQGYQLLQPIGCNTLWQAS